MRLNKLDKYIVIAIISSTLVVLFALISIDLLGKIIAEADIMGNKNYTLWRLLAYVFGLIPLRLILFFPMALLIGALMGLGKIAASNELTVMQISGFSRLRLAVLGFVVSVFMGACVLSIAEFAGVDLNRYVTDMRAEATGEIRRHYGANGIWAQDGKSFINIKGVKSDGRLAGIYIYTVDDNMQFKRMTYAKTATFSPSNWLLYQVTEKILGKKAIVIKKSKKMRWHNSLNNKIIGLLLTEPEDLSIRDLYKYIQYQKANGIKSTSYALTFWQRIFIPLSAGVMFLLALPFVFGSQRNHTQGRKLFTGIMLGITYYVSYQSIANIILLTGTPVILGAIIPIALFCTVSFSLLWLRG
ncbi:MAG: LPS export ABC transporter permease LptG [Ostreibacterium sp.]